MYYLIQLLSKIISKVIFVAPKFVQNWLGDFLGILWFDIIRLRRQLVLSNLNIAFPEWSDGRKLSVGRRSVCNLGRTFIEFLTIPFISSNWIDQNVVFEGLEYFLEAKKKNKGVLLLSSHLGNGELVASILCIKGYPLYLITKRMSSETADKFWFGIRSSHGCQFIEARNSSFEILRALKEKASVVFVQDQFSGPPIGIKSRFFGKETGTAYGLALFALKTGAPVVPIYTYRDAGGRTHVIF